MLVPGLLRGRPRWPWMVGRAALTSWSRAAVSKRDALRAGAGLFVGLAAVGGTTGLALRRSGS